MLSCGCTGVIARQSLSPPRASLASPPGNQSIVNIASFDNILIINVEPLTNLVRADKACLSRPSEGLPKREGPKPGEIGGCRSVGPRVTLAGVTAELRRLTWLTEVSH